MVMTRAQFADNFNPAFEEVFFLNLGEKDAQLSKLFNMRTMKQQYMDVAHVAGMGLMTTKAEGEEMDVDELIQGLDTRVTPVTYAKQWRITKEAIADERHNIFGQISAEVGKSMRGTRETDGANIFNNGFDSNFTANGGDSLELFSLVHPLTDGSTQRNELSTPADLSATTLEQAMIDIAATNYDSGLKMGLRPARLVVPPSLRWTAQILLQSIQDPDSANNAINPAKNLGLELVVNDYLTDSNAWFIQCDDHYLNWYDRTMPDFNSWEDGGTMDLRYSVDARWTRTWLSPWGLFGSPGGS